MKIKTFMLFAILTINIVASLADETKTPLENKENVSNEISHEASKYMSGLLQHFEEYKKLSYAYIKSVIKSRRIKTQEKKRQKLLKLIATMKTHVQNTEPFYGDPTFKNDLEAYLEVQINVMKGEFDKILDMEEIKEKSSDKWEAYDLAMEGATKKLEDSRQIILEAQKKFGEKYNIQIVSDSSELHDKIIKAGNALRYRSEIEKIFIKSNRQLSKIAEAINSQDIAALEQSASTMIHLANQGLVDLEKQPPYKGDSSLIIAARDLLIFYKKEGELRGKTNVDFFLQIDRFEKMAKKFESIKPKDRKEEDIENYNNAVKDYNKVGKNINKINKKAFKEHKSLYKKWKKQLKKFLKKHGS